MNVLFSYLWLWFIFSSDELADTVSQDNLSHTVPCPAALLSNSFQQLTKLKEYLQEKLPRGVL